MDQGAVMQGTLDQAGTLFCGDVNEPREIEGNSKLQAAFDMGKVV